MHSDWEYYSSKQADMLRMLQEMVELESPTTDSDLVNGMGAYVSSALRNIGAKVEIDRQTERGDNVIARFGPSSGMKPILMVGHMDTVFNAGTIKERPFRVEGGRAFGPGTVDMKAGLVIMLSILQAVKDLRLELSRPITLIFNSDEEIRSEFSREAIFREARDSAYALVFEGTERLNRFTTHRKASGRFYIKTIGKASHAGAAIDQGINAIEEMAHQVLRSQAMTNLSVGTTVNVGVTKGGDRANVVADWAVSDLSVRAPTSAEMDRIQRALSQLTPVLPGSEVEVTGDFHRGPFDGTSNELFTKLSEAAKVYGVDAEGGLTGGSSDANLTASVGTPTLDGLGAVGAGAHSTNEYIEVSSLPLRTAIATELVLRLT